ncbi:DNA-binding protein WhiA [Eggerthellaceae bacterium zg-1084]|uniref:Probable cell division protein WhiA n=1 Tax=Berryella wangjianweii TaxID=2734634 RepID=A0A6M8J2Y7_9ACTN|nr:DNA-binding protein WhiA [Berryella wangjianweii]NPD30452.1 DNA-binding protein WhiA [Berryella wangjianweii]NPD32755.1 DNA-binding protein WhiA [Eggerthellaceae bacterium zg-997]QKF07987.1 DNA-binding protein WhiA [Berryella wangjianweii]
MEVKNELARAEGECSHCDRAVLAALVRVEGTLLFKGPGRYGLEVSTDIPAAARLVIRLAHQLYQLETKLTMRQSVLHSSGNYLIEFPAQRSLEPALRDLGVLSDEGLVMGLAPALVTKRCCAAAYLRGAFIGSGFVSNPRGDFHFEITLESRELAEDLARLLADTGIKARIMQRRSSFIVYLKSGESILEFLAYVHANQAALRMENERVVKSVRNDVNRVTNAEMANATKAANASAEQIHAMSKVLRSYPFEKIPPALRQIIQLRALHPDATLKELGERATPPLSKSAVYHRVRRIEELARKADA